MNGLQVTDAEPRCVDMCPSFAADSPFKLLVMLTAGPSSAMLTVKTRSVQQNVHSPLNAPRCLNPEQLNQLSEETGTDRQSDEEETETDRQGDRDRRTDRWTSEETDRQTRRQTDKEETDRETDKETETDRQRRVRGDRQVI